MFYDRAGRSTTLRDYVAMISEPACKIVASDTMPGGLRVITAWLGSDNGPARG